MNGTREDRATRRRWVTLAEVGAVVGMVIGGLGLWNSWSERHTAETEKAATAAGEARARARLDLVATVESGGARATLRDDNHPVHDATVAFPRALGIAAKQPAADVTIDADWFADAILKATDGGPDEREGRMPVLVTARYWDGDVARSSTAIYDVAWRTEGRVLRGRSLRIEAVRLRTRVGTPALLDAAWARERPRTPA